MGKYKLVQSGLRIYKSYSCTCYNFSLFEIMLKYNLPRKGMFKISHSIDNLCSLKVDIFAQNILAAILTLKYLVQHKLHHLIL